MDWNDFTNDRVHLTFRKSLSNNDTLLELITNALGETDHVNIIVAIVTCLLNITLQSVVVHLLRILATNRGKTIGGVLSLHLCFI